MPSFTAKGGITSVVRGYRESQIEKDYCATYIETYCDGNKLRKIGAALKSYVRFMRILRRERPELIHIHSSFGGSFYRKLPFILLGHRKHIPVVNHIHGSELDKLYTSAGKRKQKRVRSALDKCSRIIVLSKEMKEAMHVVGTRTPITVIHNYSVIRPSIPPMAERKKQVLFLGFITELKGCYDIPQIARRVIGQVPEATFVLGGTGEIEKICDLCREAGVGSSVSFPGWLGEKEKNACLLESAVFLLPSYTEAMPMSILEAMGFGLPVVSTRVGGIPKLVEDGYNGLLYAPGDVEGIASGLIRLLGSEELREKYGRQGYERAGTEFSYEDHIRRILEVYREILTK